MGTPNGPIILLLLIATFGCDANTDIHSACEGSLPDDILLKRGHWYSYDAHFVANAGIVGGSDEDTQLDLKCSVKVRHSSECAYTLEFETCSARAAKGNEQKRNPWIDIPSWTQFSEHPIAFTVNDGEVRTVLSHPSDPISFVNLKKGFISSIVIGNQPTPEAGKTRQKEHRDVQGLCPLSLSAKGDKVHADKKLTRCVLPKRPQVQLSPFSIFWTMDFVTQLVNSTLVCDSNLEKGQLLRKMDCHEKHALIVDSAYSTKYGIRTAIKYNIVLEETGTTESGSGLQVDQLRETNIEYEYPVPTDEPYEDTTAARELLEALLDEPELELESIPTFLALVERMRHLEDVSELTHVAETCPDGEQDCLRRRRGIPLYLDALAHCNRLPCVKALRDMHNRKLVSKTFLEFALFSWLRMPLTDHRYFNEFLEMCRNSQSRFCWFGLGGLVRTYSQSHEEIPESVREVVHLVSTSLGRSCGLKEVSYPRGTVTDQKPNYIMTMLKALGNMGKVVLEVEPELKTKVLNCVRNSDLTTPPRIIALQTLEQLGLTSSAATVNSVFAFLLNESLSVDLRLTAYDVVVAADAIDIAHASELAHILKDDSSKQVKSYIASDIVERQRQGSNRFWITFDEEVTKNSVDLLDLASQDPLTTSHVVLHESRSSLPRGIFPDDLSQFGHSLLMSTVFGSWSAIPQSITTKLNLTMFGHVLEFMEAGLQMSGLDALFIRSSAAMSGMQASGSSNFMQYLVLIMQQLSGQRTPPRAKSKSTPILLNEKWEDNLDRIYQTYQNSHSQAVTPHVMLYLRMLGLDLDYTTLPDVVGAIQHLVQSMNQRHRPSKATEENLPFSETHFLNMAEAEHLVPTLMGGLVKWRTNSTIGASLDASMEFNMKERNGKLQFKPRLAITLYNQMKYAIDGLTEMGTLMVNNLFSGTEFDIRGSAQNRKPFKFSIVPPKRRQRPFEISRNNYIVAGSELTEIKDWDAERVNLDHCLEGKFIKATGMRVCIKATYLDVQHREDKPFYYVAGRASWALSAEMEDKGVDAYSIEVNLDTKTKEEFNLDITGDGKGTTFTREIPLKVYYNKDTTEFLLHLTHSDFPDFNFEIKRQRMMEDNKPVGFQSSVLVEDEGKQWNLNYVKTRNKEIRQDKPMSRNESPTHKHLEAHVDERALTFQTPYNNYKFRLKLHKQPRSGKLKVDSLLAYENLVEDHNWLRSIMPQIFWEEGNRRAYLEFRGDWRFGNPTKGSHQRGHHSSSTESKSHLSIPATVIEVVSHHQHKPKHTSHRFNVSKVERSTGHLLLFANMTYNVWRKGKEDEPVNEIRLANLTLARHSWSLESHRQGNLYAGREGEVVAKYVLTGEKMIPKDKDTDGNYIGWWSPETASRFTSIHWEVVYDQHLKRKPVGENDVPVDGRKEIEEDLSSEENDGHSSEEEFAVLGSPGIKNQAIDADISLSYPYGEKQENITFKGTFQWNGRISPAYRMFLKTFTLASTLHALQLNSHSLWTKAGNDKLVLQHHSTFTDTETQKNHGTYDLLYRKQIQPGSCKSVLLNHTISAHWFNFASHVIGNCKAGKPKARLYDIEIHAGHPYWKELDFDLSQKFDLDMPGGESMTLTSPTMDIKVIGDWSVGKYHKKAEFNSKTDVMPSTVWELTSDKETGELDFSIDAPEEDLQNIRVHRKLYKSLDRIEYEIQHKDRGIEEYQEDVHIMAKIINSHSILVNGSYDPELGARMGLWLVGFLHSTVHRIGSKLADPNHELNQHLKEHLQGKTIMEYLLGLERKIGQKVNVVLKDIYEILRTFESFYGPSFQIVANTVKELKVLSQELTYELSQSHLGWAWNYFEVERHLNVFLNHMMRGTTRILQRQDYMTVISHPFTWNKFSQWPTLDKSDFLDLLRWTYRRRGTFTLPARDTSERVAMVFGPSHVLTFDGHHYRFPDYPSDSCTILLAQDVRGKSFSVLINKESLFFVFPELALTIHGSGRLYVNTSKSESPTPIHSPNRNINALRFGDIIRVDSPYLRVDCDTSNEFCVFVLNPILSGGIIGLLGNADGERHNDFAGPGEHVASQVSELGAIYEVSGDAACKKFTEPQPLPVEDAQATRRCDRLFKQPNVEKCLASAGIKEVDLRPACVSDFYREGCPCTTSKALTALCAYEGFSLDRCQFQRRPQGSSPVPNQHDAWLIKGTHQLQMVIAVEAHGNVLGGGSPQAFKGVETLLENVEEAFTTEGGYSTILYSLLVFGEGGKGEPHMHTQHKSSWMVQRDLMKSLREVHYQGSRRGDPVTAVEFATSMITFEPSATKMVLLITLDDSPEAAKHGSKHIHAVQHQLERDGTVLYVLSSYPTVERGKKIFGLRADGLIFPHDGGDAYGEYPRSPAAKMVAGTRGSIFFRSMLEENKNPYFFESLAGEMLARVLKETGKCRLCVCSMSPWWQVQTHCKPAPNHLQSC